MTTEKQCFSGFLLVRCLSEPYICDGIIRFLYKHSVEFALIKESCYNKDLTNVGTLLLDVVVHDMKVKLLSCYL